MNLKIEKYGVKAVGRPRIKAKTSLKIKKEDLVKIKAILDNNKATFKRLADL